MLAVSRSACRATGSRSRPARPLSPGQWTCDAHGDSSTVAVVTSFPPLRAARINSTGARTMGRRRAPNRRAGEPREDEVRPRPEQVCRQRDHDEPRTAFIASPGVGQLILSLGGRDADRVSCRSRLRRSTDTVRPIVAGGKCPT